MGLCMSNTQQDEVKPTVPGGASNRGRVRRLSLAVDEAAAGGAAAPKQEPPRPAERSAEAGAQDAKPAKWKRRMSIISGDLGGDAGFGVDSQAITFFDGAQIDDGNTVKIAGKSGDQFSMSIPAWMRIGASSRAGHDGVGKKINQDAYVVTPYLAGAQDQLFFGVFDGHGTEGHLVSRFISRAMPRMVADQLTRMNLVSAGTNELGKMLTGVFRELESTLFRSAIDTTLSGTTAVVAILRGYNLVLAHAGDSRTVIGRLHPSGKVVAEALTVDHKPETPSERQRIEAAGGLCKQMYIPETDEYIGPVRVWSAAFDYRGPGIAMSRSIGDQMAGDVGVICDPEVSGIDLNLERDRVIVMASDGVWEFVEDQEAIQLAMAHYPSCTAAASAIANESLKRWRSEEEVVDDITVIVLFFVPPEGSAAGAAAGSAKAST